MANQVVKGTATADTQISISLADVLNRSVYLLAFSSSNSSYVGAYIITKIDSLSLNIIPLKQAQSITITVEATALLIKSATYGTPYTLINLTGFMK